MATNVGSTDRVSELAGSSAAGEPERRGAQQKSQSSAAERLVVTLAILLPCRYLWPLRADYNDDWYIHKWIIGYFGEYFRRHAAMPAVLNTTQWGGVALPIFYGNLGYPILAVFSSILAPWMVIRLAVLFLFAAQYYLVFRALGQLQAPRWFSHSVACLVIWTTYPLTNLFNRSALTEFFATSLLVCALALAILLFHAPSKALERRYASRMMLCLVVSAGTHPLTAMFGVPFFCVLAGLWWRTLRESPERRRSIVRSLVPGFLGVLACMAPWLYATAKYAERLKVRYANPSVVFLPEPWDWLSRFYPIPFDKRVQPGIPLTEIWGPHLDAQVNVPLLILLLALSVGALCIRRELGRPGRFLMPLGISVSLFAFFTWISLSPDSYHYLPSIFELIQFSYRAVTYQNLALLLGVFLLLMALRSSTSIHFLRILKHRLFRVTAVGCLVLSAYGVTVKWSHIRAGRSSRGDESTPLMIQSDAQRQELITVPVRMYSIYDYITPNVFVSLEDQVAKNAGSMIFGFDSQDDFGKALPLNVALDESSWGRTNVQAFPWNRFEIDGRDLPESDMRIYDGLAIALRIPAGNHRLVLKFVPDPLWKILRMISLFSLFGWLLTETVLGAIQPWFRGKPVTDPA